MQALSVPCVILCIPEYMMTSSNGNIFRVTGPLGIHLSPVNSRHKGQWRGALMFSLICAWINGWVNNREAGDLRRHRSHYDVSVMSSHILLTFVFSNDPFTLLRICNTIKDECSTNLYSCSLVRDDREWGWLKTYHENHMHVYDNTCMLNAKWFMQISHFHLHDDVIKWKHFPRYCH